MLRHKASVAILAVSLLLLPSSFARAQQSLNIQLGAFAPLPEHERSVNDVLVTNSQYLWFNMRDFRAFTSGVEWLVAVGDNLEAGVGAGFYQRAVPSVYNEWEFEGGGDISQEMKLRMVPVIATLKYLPFGARSSFQPYIGAGVAVYFWRYSETGDFVDFSDNSIYQAAYVSTGTSVGPVATFGVRARVSRQATAGVEVRAQWGHGNLSNDFLSNRIDLGGVSVLGTLGIRF